MALTQEEISNILSELFMLPYESDSTREGYLASITKFVEDLDNNKIVISGKDKQSYEDRTNLSAVLLNLSSTMNYEGLELLLKATDVEKSYPKNDPKFLHFDVLWGIANPRVGALTSLEIMMDAGFDISEYRISPTTDGTAKNLISDVLHEVIQQFRISISETKTKEDQEACVHDYKITALLLRTGKIVGIDPQFGIEMATKIESELAEIIGENDENLYSLTTEKTYGLMQHIIEIFEHRVGNLSQDPVFQERNYELQNVAKIERIYQHLPKSKSDNIFHDSLSAEIKTKPSYSKTNIQTTNVVTTSGDEKESNQSTPEKIAPLAEKIKPRASNESAIVSTNPVIIPPDPSMVTTPKSGMIGSLMGLFGGKKR